MAKTRLSAAKFVERGYGQVEPNLLSAQVNGQIYAQLPAAADIDKLENGQFAKYDYAKGVVNFTGAGEWMMVFNEIKTYRDFEGDCDFAMLKDDYAAAIYSPVGQVGGDFKPLDYTNITKNPDPYEHDSTKDPFSREMISKPAAMPANTTMVPRLFKTMVGDIFTTNMIDEETLNVTDVVAPRAADGILAKDGDLDAMKFQVVKVYTMPDGQKGVKLMRIA